MAKIEFNTYDLQIGKTKEGDEVLQFKNGFNEDLIEEMKVQGVKVVVKRDAVGEDQPEL